jgi:hypothetical protein
MDFEQRLQSALQRGQQRGEAKAREARAKALSADELKTLHAQYRLQFSELIENCLRRLPKYCPGFRFETLFGDRGWGAACSRDDMVITGGRRHNAYSRFEMTVRPFSEFHVVELVAKGTVRNKELLHHSFYQKIEEAVPAHFTDLIDAWTLEYAELFASKS